MAADALGRGGGAPNASGLKSMQLPTYPRLDIDWLTLRRTKSPA